MKTKAKLEGAVNLAHKNRNEAVYVPVSIPGRYGSTRGKVLGKVACGDGGAMECVVATNEQRDVLGRLESTTVYYLDYVSGKLLCQHTVEGEVYAAFATDGVVTLLTSEGSEYYLVDPDAATATRIDTDTPPPAIAIVAAETSERTASFGASPLQGPYVHGEGRLAPVDQKYLTVDALRAYRNLISTAADYGEMIQPSLMRYRMVDSRGESLYESPVVLVSADAGFQVMGSLSMGVSTDRTTRNGATLYAKGYKPALMLTSEPDPVWAERVEAIEVLASPQIHPIDFEGECNGRVMSTDVITFNLPGTGGIEGESEYLRSLVSRMVELSEQTMRVVARIERPFGPRGLIVGTRQRMNVLRMADARAEWRQQQRLLAKHYYPATGVIERFASPHRFTASMVARAGAVLLYANPVQLPFAGHSLESMATRFVDGAWSASVVVTLGDEGEQVVWSGSGTGKCPHGISPVLSYPSQRATSMTIYFTDPTGRSYRHEMPLTAVPGRELAYYVHPGLKPWNLSTIVGGWSRPEPTAKPRPLEGYVVAALTPRPHTLLSALKVSPSPIKALTAASRSASAFDFGKAHFYAASAWGICSIATSGTSILASASLIDRRGVSSPSMMTVGADRSYALASGDLLELSGNRTTVLARNIGAKGIGWSSAHGGELWLIGMDGKARVYHPEDGSMSRRECSVSEMWSDGSSLIAMDAEGMRRIAYNSIHKFIPGERIHVEFETEPEIVGSGTHTIVEAPLSGSAVSGSVEVYGSNDQGFKASRLLMRYNVDGSGGVANPRQKMLRPRCRYVKLKVRADVSTDTEIS